MARLLTAFFIAAPLFVTLAFPAWAVDGRTRRDVKERVEAAQPGVRWNARGIEELDINCDGNPDFAIGGRGDGTYFVAVVMGPLRRTTGSLIVDLPTGSEGEVVCDRDPKLLVQSSDYDPGELTVGEPPEGFRRSESCQELAIGFECTKFHIYWNYVASRLGVWR
jgi:hypothetical protein